MFTSLIHVQYCYDYLINQIPVGLLLYSHIPTALAALIFGGYVVAKVRRLSSLTLFIVCASFAAWCFADLSSWFSFLGSDITMFTWSLLDFLALVFFFFSYYFLYTFITQRDLPLWQKVVGMLLLAPTAYWTLSGQNLIGYDANTCEALEHEAIVLYPYVAEIIALLATLALAVIEFRKSREARHRAEILLATAGVFSFLLFFFLATLGVNFLVNYDIGEYAYNFEIYGLFGMPVLLIYLGYLIVRYRAFDLRIFGAQALVLALVALIGSQFAFVQSTSNRVLISVTLVLTGVIGIVLMRSVKKEIRQREQIELQEKELEKANEQQVVLIHFITHQIKGFVTKSRNIFSTLLEGDFGVIPDSARPLVEEGLRSDTKGAETIQEILNAANIKSGKVTYAQESVDLKALIESIIQDLKPAADAKALALTFTPEGDSLAITGDRMQLTNAIKNLIDNSVKYTPTGKVDVSLAKQEGKVRLTIKDTGVGISPEDMKQLFTEGGHGKESTKINVDSTGFGLYIVKNIIEAHHGRVWAESEGTGKGSTFVVELPVV